MPGSVASNTPREIDPAPVKVELDLYFNRLMRETRDPKLLGVLPYLSLGIHTFSTGEKRLSGTLILITSQTRLFTPR